MLTENPPVVDAEFIKNYRESVLSDKNVEQMEKNFARSGGGGGDGVISILMDSWVLWDSTTQKFLTNEKTPFTPKQGNTKNGKGKWYSQGFRGIFTDIQLGPNARRRDDGILEIQCPTIVYADEKVKAYLLKNKVAPYYVEDSDAPSLATSAWFPVVPGTLQDFSVLSFQEGEMLALKKEDPTTRLPLLRRGQKAVVSAANIKVYARIKSKTYTRNEVDVVEETFEPIVSFESRAVVYEKTPTFENTSLSERLHQHVKKDIPFCVDISKILDQSAVMPQKGVFWLPASGFFLADNDSLLRVILPLTKDKILLDPAAPILKFHVKYMFRDNWPARKEIFNHDVVLWNEAVRQTGLDIEQPDLVADLMAAHPLSLHIFAKFDEAATRALGSNHASSLPDSDAPSGNFSWTADSIIVDWEDTCINAKEAIEIDKDTFLKAMKEPNAAKASSQKNVKTVSVDGKDELWVRSMLTYENPVVTDGAASKVVIFGSGERPTHGCDDANVFLSKKGTRFFALTTVSKADTEPWTTAEEGSRVFWKQFSAGIGHQLIVIQGSDEDEKKAK